MGGILSCAGPEILAALASLATECAQLTHDRVQEGMSWFVTNPYIFYCGVPIENARVRGADLEHDLNQLDLED